MSSRQEIALSGIRAERHLPDHPSQEGAGHDIPKDFLWVLKRSTRREVTSSATAKKVLESMHQHFMLFENLRQSNAHENAASTKVHLMNDSLTIDDESLRLELHCREVYVEAIFSLQEEILFRKLEDEAWVIRYIGEEDWDPPELRYNDRMARRYRQWEDCYETVDCLKKRYGPEYREKVTELLKAYTPEMLSAVTGDDLETARRKLYDALGNRWQRKLPEVDERAIAVEITRRAKIAELEGSREGAALLAHLRAKATAFYSGGRSVLDFFHTEEFDEDPFLKSRYHAWGMQGIEGFINAKNYEGDFRSQVNGRLESWTPEMVAIILGVPLKEGARLLDIARWERWRTETDWYRSPSTGMSSQRRPLPVYFT